LRQVTKTWPAVTTVSVTDALNVANDLIGQLATAIRAAASIALAASVLVLGGALAAGNRARVHDAVVLKTLGATRGTLITAYVLEYMLLGLATALFALVAGSVAGWYVVVEIMKLKAQFLPDVCADDRCYSAGADGRFRPRGNMARSRPEARTGAKNDMKHL
jgi:putative ABC transport system permease protein